MRPRIRHRGLRTVCSMGLCLALAGCDFLMTPDQQGHRLYRREQHAEACERFTDPMWKGACFYRGGDFEMAAGMFAGFDAPEAAFNQGNALVLQGKYDQAVSRYDRALELRPAWESAMTNRAIAMARAKRMETQGGDMTGGQLGADDITFEKGPSSPEAGGEQVEGGEPLSDSAMRAAWLRRVQTRPADFLRAKFAYQKSRSTGED